MSADCSDDNQVDGNNKVDDANQVDVDSADDLYELVRRLEESLQELEGRNDELEAKNNELEAKVELMDERLYILGKYLEELLEDRSLTKTKNKSGKRYYAVLRGKFNEANNNFEHGIYDDAEECALVTRGAWKGKQKVFRSLEEAQWWYNEQLSNTLEENSTFFNEHKVFSEKWYAVWALEPEFWYRIVPTSEEAASLFDHRADTHRKGFSTYKAADEHIKALIHH